MIFVIYAVKLAFPSECVHIHVAGVISQEVFALPKSMQSAVCLEEFNKQWKLELEKVASHRLFTL